MKLNKEQKSDFFKQLREKYMQYVYIIVQSRIDDSLIEDVCQEIWMTCYSVCDRIKDMPEEDRKRYIGAIAKNTAGKIMKQESKNDFLHFEDVKNKNEPLEYAENYENAVAEAISQLPEIYSSIFTMRYLSECSIKDIGRALGISEVAVLKRISRGKKLLKRILERYGYKL